MEEFQIPTNAAEAEGIIEGLNSPAEPEAAPQVEAAPQEFSIPYKGKDEKYPIEKILEFANQGRDYSENMRNFNARLKADVEKMVAPEREKWAQLEQKFSRYSEVENYIKQDPAWWDHVQNSYQQKVSGQAPQGANTPPDPAIKALIDSQLAPLRDFVAEAKQREMAQQAEKEDLAVDQQINQYREKHAHFDWTTVDENGLDLEKRILEHGVKLGLNKPEHFTVAANDYLHDEHVKRAAESAKGAVGKHLQKINKLGLGPVTDHQTMKIKRVENVTAKSWDEISQEAQAAAGIN